MLEKLPAEVRVHEVGPRDGLQNEAVTVATADKLRLVEALADAGLSRIELTSFVSPKWIPPLADADAVAAGARRRPGLRYTALVPNAPGLERALASGIDEAAVFLSASETHNRKNTNRSIAASLSAYETIVSGAKAAGLRVRGYISTVWGCPYEGTVDPLHSREIALSLLAMGCDEISLGDTIGVGTPGQTERIVGTMLERIPADRLALHFHDTRGTALANALTGLVRGIATLDASIGGLGGCPYAPGAAGNLATEDLVYLLDGLGIRTGVDLERLVDAGALAQELVGRQLPGRYLKARLAERAGAGRRETSRFD